MGDAIDNLRLAGPLGYWIESYRKSLRKYCRLLSESGVGDAAVLIGFNPNEGVKTRMGDEVHKVEEFRKGVVYVVTVFDKPQDIQTIWRAQHRVEGDPLPIPIHFLMPTPRSATQDLTDEVIFSRLTPDGTNFIGAANVRVPVTE